MKVKPFENLSLKDIKDEVWKDIEDFEGYYQVSNMGRIKSLKRNIIFKQQKPTRSGGKNANRLRVMFSSKELNFKKHLGVAILVIKAFSKEKSLGREVYHKNYNSLDNRIKNLFYGTLDDRSNMISSSINRTKEKINKYRGVSKVTRYIMSINIDGKVIKKDFNNEIDAAKKYDFYIKKYNLKREGNFINKKTKQ